MPNGAVRAEFETKADQTILAEQRLKGSVRFSSLTTATK